MWQGTESPEDSGNFTTASLSFKCAADSPIQCSSVPSTSSPALGYIFSFGEDLNKDVYILSSNGVYRVARPSRCKYTCPMENTTDLSNPGGPPASPLPSKATQLSKNLFWCFVLLLSWFILFVLG